MPPPHQHQHLEVGALGRPAMVPVRPPTLSSLHRSLQAALVSSSHSQRQQALVPPTQQVLHIAIRPTRLNLHAQCVVKVCILVLRTVAALVLEVTRSFRASSNILAKQNVGCCVVQAVWPLEQVQALVNRPTPASRYGVDTCSRLHC